MSSWNIGAGGKAELPKVPVAALPPPASSIKPFATFHS